jgi:hypothetical protein
MGGGAASRSALLTQQDELMTGLESVGRELQSAAGEARLGRQVCA